MTLTSPWRSSSYQPAPQRFFNLPSFAFLAALLIHALPLKAKEPVEVVRISDNIYGFVADPESGAVSNAGIVVLEHCVLVFDTHFTPEAGQLLLSKIRAITPKPVKYVVNSHFHPDHTHGNQVFGAGVQIFSHANARRDILQVDIPAMNRTLGIAQAQIEKLQKELDQIQDQNQKSPLRNQINARRSFVERMSAIKVRPPLLTFEDSLKISDGANEIDLLFRGGGHTDGDAVLFIPAEKVAFLGDLFFSNAIPNTQDANLHAWIDTLREIMKLDAEKFLPGHGPVGTRRDLSAFLAYLEELKALVLPAVERGDSLEQAVRDISLPPRYASYRFPNFFPANVQKMYTELKALQTPTEESGESRKPDPAKRKP